MPFGIYSSRVNKLSIMIFDFWVQWWVFMCYHSFLLLINEVDEIVASWKLKKFRIDKRLIILVDRCDKSYSYIKWKKIKKNRLTPKRRKGQTTRTIKKIYYSKSLKSSNLFMKLD